MCLRQETKLLDIQKLSGVHKSGRGLSSNEAGQKKATTPKRAVLVKGTGTG